MAQDLPTRLKSHLAPHPRILLGDVAGKAIAEAKDARVVKLRERIVAEAESTLALRPLKRELTGRRLLSVSREALSRIATQALAFRCTGDKRFAEAAKQNMLAVCSFEDFNPSHFLDVAEMTAALGIGYDWLFAELSAEERATIRQTIIAKGLEPSFVDPPHSWTAGHNNWNQVCNGGLLIGALAIADEAPALAQRTVERAIKGLPVIMKHYSPDGGYPEGAMYWAYGTTYNVLAIATLQSALGDDFGLLEQPGFMKTADYRLHITGPTGLCFSHGDGSESATKSPVGAQFFLADRRKDPSLLFNDLRSLDELLERPVKKDDYRLGNWMMLLWLPPGLDVAAPTNKHYVAGGDTPVAFFRSSWGRDATFVGINGGSPGTSHAHMDIGGFALDANGVRWAADLGLQSYHSLEQAKIKLWDFAQGSPRWKVYRLGPLPHNILTVDGQEQHVKGRAMIVRSSPRSAVIDLSPVYAGQLAEAKRGIVLREDKSVRLQDEIRGETRSAATSATQPATNVSTEPSKPAVVRWAMLTRADVELTGGSVATLRQDGKTLRATIVSPAGAEWRIVSTDPPNKYDDPNPGSRLLTFEIPLRPGEAKTLVVDFTPAGEAGAAVSIVPLEKW